jgi:hypothetical protein
VRRAGGIAALAWQVDKWISISVPPIIDEQTFALAQERLVDLLRLILIPYISGLVRRHKGSVGTDITPLLAKFGRPWHYASGGRGALRRVGAAALPAVARWA